MNTNSNSRPNAMGVDFKAIASRLKKSNNEQILRIASAQLPHNIGILKGIMEAFIPAEHQTNFYIAVSAVISSTAQVAMLEYRLATKAVDHEASEEGSRAKGELSRALTRRVAQEKRGQNGEGLTPAQLVKHVQAEREKCGLLPLGKSREGSAKRGDSALRAVSRHLDGFSY